MEYFLEYFRIDHRFKLTARGMGFDFVKQHPTILRSVDAAVYAHLEELLPIVVIIILYLSRALAE